MTTAELIFYAAATATAYTVITKWASRGRSTIVEEVESSDEYKEANKVLSVEEEAPHVK